MLLVAASGISHKAGAAEKEGEPPEGKAGALCSPCEINYGVPPKISVALVESLKPDFQ